MGGVIGAGVSIINLFLSGPLLTYAWRSRGYLADATAVDLTRDPEGLARALARLESWVGGDAPGTAWLELLLVVAGRGGRSTPAGSVPSLSDSGLGVPPTPPGANRLRRLRAMGSVGPASRDMPRRGFPRWLVLVIAPFVALIGILVVVVAAMLIYLAALAAFIVLTIVAGPINELLRGLAGR
jgi:hypothetical protein